MGELPTAGTPKQVFGECGLLLTQEGRPRALGSCQFKGLCRKGPGFPSLELIPKRRPQAGFGSSRVLSSWGWQDQEWGTRPQSGKIDKEKTFLNSLQRFRLGEVPSCSQLPSKVCQPTLSWLYVPMCMALLWGLNSFRTALEAETNRLGSSQASPTKKLTSAQEREWQQEAYIILPGSGPG